MIPVLAAGLTVGAPAGRREEAAVREAIGKPFTRPVPVLLGIALPRGVGAERPVCPLTSAVLAMKAGGGRR